MKRTIVVIALIAISRVAAAQLSFTPYVGMNATKLKDGIIYQNGGAFVTSGFDLEIAKKPSAHSKIYLTAATGAAYLSNGFYYSGNFAYTAVNFYTQRITDLRTQYLQIPLVLRLHWQPFPLVEEWKVFLGAGVLHTSLIKSTLQETYTIVTLNSDPLAPPQVAHYEDNRDVTSYGKKNGLFQRIELGMKYKRFQLSYRISKSITDMYRTGLENDWKVPAEDSWYISSYQDAGKIIEKHSELTLGFRFGGAR